MTESVTLNVSGMKCGGCEANVTSKLQGLEGVQTVKASSAEKTVYVEFDHLKTTIAAIRTTITAAGFTVDNAPSN